jgi:4'-phosphopantetheinyl transferase
MTRVYALQIDTSPDEATYRSLLAMVSTNKQDKIRKFLHNEDAQRALFADLLIRYLVSHLPGINGAAVSFEYNEFGKPSVSGLENFHFNISHSGKWIVCTTGDTPVGIDIERIAPIDMEVAENYFSKYECGRLLSLNGPDQLSFFYQLWTCKESYLKCIGTGLSYPLDSFSVVMNDQGNVGIESAFGTREAVYLQQYQIDNEYKMAVCASQDNFGRIQFISLREIISHFHPAGI